MNWSLFCVVYLIAATVTMGIFIIGVLIMGFNEISHVQIAIALGALVSIPAAMFFAKKIGNLTGNENSYKA